MPIVFQRASGSIGTSHSIDIGQPGNNRLIVAVVCVERRYYDIFRGNVLVDNKVFTQAVVADNPDGLGNHLELHTISEERLGSSSGIVNISYTDGDSNWIIHILVFYGVANDTLVDFGKEDKKIGFPVSVENISSNDGSLIIMATGNGTGETRATFSWSVPLIERTQDPTPHNFCFGTASGIESVGQINKTYTVNETRGLRSTGIVVVFDPATDKEVEQYQMIL